MREFSQDLGESFVCFFPCHDEDSLYFLVIEDIVKTGSKMEGNVAYLSEAVLRHMPLVRFEISRLHPCVIFGGLYLHVCENMVKQTEAYSTLLNSIARTILHHRDHHHHVLKDGILGSI